VSPPDPDQSKGVWRSNDIPKAPAPFGNMNRSHPGAFSPTYGMSGPISPGLHPQEPHDFSNQSSSIESFALPLPIGKSAFKSVSFATLGMHAARGLPVCLHEDIQPFGLKLAGIQDFSLYSFREQFVRDREIFGRLKRPRQLECASRSYSDDRLSSHNRQPANGRHGQHRRAVGRRPCSVTQAISIQPEPGTQPGAEPHNQADTAGTERAVPAQFVGRVPICVCAAPSPRSVLLARTI
jgi:hypothetical protein